MEKMYLVYALDENGYVKGEKRLTNRQNLAKCAKSVKNDYGVRLAHYNQASMCFDGYIVQGEYMGLI